MSRTTGRVVGMVLIRTIRFAFSFALVFWGIVPNVNAQPRYIITVLPDCAVSICGDVLAQRAIER
jgi:hypothetical protein